jgi:TerC family integral membrane protein
MYAPIWLWAAFLVGVIALLVLDLGVFNRRAHEISTGEAALLSAFWIALSLAFNAVLWLWQGQDVGLQFLTGYLIEKALSVDNLFVFLLLFGAFGVPAAYQHRVLYWGVLGALILRGVFIGFGIALIDNFDWVFYVFGAFLIFAALRMLLSKESEVDPKRNVLVRLAHRFFRVTEEYEGPRFFVRRGAQRWATPLLLTLLVIEGTDVVFAFDSIPAVFSVTTNAFIAYSSNVMAVLGLRALYFLLASSIKRFAYLSYSLAIILAFVGVKMLLRNVVEVPIAVSLGVISAALLAGILASGVRGVVVKRRAGRAAAKVH